MNSILTVCEEKVLTFSFKCGRFDALTQQLKKTKILNTKPSHFNSQAIIILDFPLVLLNLFQTRLKLLQTNSDFLKNCISP